MAISNEALAVFVRFWLTSTPALPDSTLAAAQTKGRERYEGARWTPSIGQETGELRETPAGYESRYPCEGEAKLHSTF